MDCHIEGEMVHKSWFWVSTLLWSGIYGYRVEFCNSDRYPFSSRRDITKSGGRVAEHGWLPETCCSRSWVRFI
jgi:hypothetical protein